MHHKVKILTFVLSISFQIECNLTPKIEEGLEMEISRWPYQISLIAKPTNFSKKFEKCTGSIIGDKEILTAAHCVMKTGSYAVRVGSNYTRRGGDIYNVSEVIIHPKFRSRTYENDISLLILEEPIRFSKKATIIGLPEQDKEVEIESKFTVSGWREMYTHELYSSNRSLKFSIIETIPSKICSEKYWNMVMKIPDKFCAFAKEKHSCPGESGGPAVFNRTLIGILSWWIIDDMCPSYFPAVYTRVSSYYDWIISTLSKLREKKKLNT